MGERALFFRARAEPEIWELSPDEPEPDKIAHRACFELWPRLAPKILLDIQLIILNKSAELRPGKKLGRAIIKPARASPGFCLTLCKPKFRPGPSSPEPRLVSPLLSITLKYSHFEQEYRVYDRGPWEAWSLPTRMCSLISGSSASQSDGPFWIWSSRNLRQISCGCRVSLRLSWDMRCHWPVQYHAWQLERWF